MDGKKQLYLQQETKVWMKIYSNRLTAELKASHVASKKILAVKSKELGGKQFSADWWQMMMKTCSCHLHRWQSPHLWQSWQRLTAAFISHFFFLFFCIFSKLLRHQFRYSAVHSSSQLQGGLNCFPSSHTCRTLVYPPYHPHLPSETFLEPLGSSTRGRPTTRLGTHLESSQPEWFSCLDTTPTGSRILQTQD